jgi:hypothetical protein
VVSEFPDYINIKCFCLKFIIPEQPIFMPDVHFRFSFISTILYSLPGNTIGLSLTSPYCHTFSNYTWGLDWSLDLLTYKSLSTSNFSALTNSRILQFTIARTKSSFSSSSESETELRYDLRFTVNQFISVPSPMRTTISIYFSTERLRS